MKAINEIGLSKSLNFIWFSLLEVFISLLFLPNIRTAVLRILGAQIGENTLIFDVTFMNLYRGKFSNLKIGQNCYIGRGVLLDLAGEISIFDNVTISERSNILTHLNVGYKDHPLQKHYPSYIGKVIINSDSFIGLDSTILPNVEIGNKCVVGAASVVTKNINNNTVVAGNPAAVIKVL